MLRASLHKPTRSTGPPVKATGLWPRKSAARWCSREARWQKSLLQGAFKQGHLRRLGQEGLSSASELPALLHPARSGLLRAGSRDGPGKRRRDSLHLLMSHTWVEQHWAPGLGWALQRQDREGLGRSRCVKSGPQETRKRRANVPREKALEHRGQAKLTRSRRGKLAVGAAHKRVLLAQGLVYNLN